MAAGWVLGAALLAWGSRCGRIRHFVIQRWRGYEDEDEAEAEAAARTRRRTEKRGNSESVIFCCGCWEQKMKQWPNEGLRCALSLLFRAHGPRNRPLCSERASKAAASEKGRRINWQSMK